MTVDNDNANFQIYTMSAYGSAPTNGSKLFVDSADNNLKSKDSSGSVVTVVTT